MSLPINKKPRAGIVGSGLLGRLFAWRLLQENWEVELFEKNTQSGQGSAAYAAGGMLSFLTEQEKAEPLIRELGIKSISYWKTWLPQLNQPVFFEEKGNILLSHTTDQITLNHFAHRIQQRIGEEKIKTLSANALQNLEPELNFQRGYYLKDEAQLDTRELLNALRNTLLSTNIKWHTNTKVTHLQPNKITTQAGQNTFDCVFDCRGIGAQTSHPDLRPVRGELIYLQAPNVQLSHVIHFFHPRYRLYIIPRPQHIYLLGATEIESMDESPISVRSCLELLSTAYSIHKGFAEARIIETITATRAAFPDNLPRLSHQPGLVSINGLYRHGFLIAPALVEKTIQNIKKGKTQ